MKRWLGFITMVFAGLTANSQGFEFSTLVTKSHTERTIALFDYYGNELRSKDSAAAYKDIETVNRLADEFVNEDFRLEAILIEAHYCAYNESLTKAEVKDRILKQIVKAEETGKLWLVARLHSLLAGYMHGKHQHALAFKHYVKTNQLLREAPSDKYPIKPMCLVMQGMIHLTFKEFEQSNMLLHRSIPAFQSHGSYYHEMLAHSGLASNYRSLNMLDSSNYWYEKQHKIAIEHKDSVWQAIAAGNIGENYCLMGKYERAKPLLKQDLAGTEKPETWGNASNAAALLGEVFLQAGNTDSAQFYLRKAINYAHLTEDFRRLAVVYPKLAKLFSVLDNDQLAAAYLDSALMAKDSVSRVFDKLVLNRVTQELELEKIAIALALVVFGGKRKLLPWAFGGALYMAYVILIGGDFMSGRFFAAPFLVAVMLISPSAFDFKPVIAVAALCLGFVPDYPTLATPWKQPTQNLDSELEYIDENGISNEWAFYYPETGFAIREGQWPAGDRISAGRRLKSDKRSIYIDERMGFLPFFAGSNLHVIDRNAITDAFLSKLPNVYVPNWRPGHYARIIPEGYLESKSRNMNVLKDAELRNLYDDIQLIVSSDLFAPERLRAIFELTFTDKYDSTFLDFQLPVTDTVSIAELNNPIGNSMNWNDPGHIILCPSDGVMIELQEANTFAKRLEAWVSSGCFFVVAFRDGDTVLDGTILSPINPEAQLSGHLIPLTNSQMNNVLIYPLSGSCSCSVARVRLVN